MVYTNEQKQAARQELAKRELARRQQSAAPQQNEEEEVPYTPPPARTGLGGIWEDVKDIPGKVLDYGMEVPGKALESWGQIFNHPGRALKNVAAGAGEALESPINLLGAIGPYFKEKKIPVLGSLPGFQIPNLGIENKMGLENQQPGDELLRQMMMFAPAARFKIPGLSNVAKRAAALTEHGPLTSKLEQLEAKHGNISAQHAQDVQNLNALKEHLESLPGFQSSKSSVLKRKATEANQELAKLREQSQAVPEHLRATEEFLAPEKTPISLVEPIKSEQTNLADIKKPEISEEPIEQAENILKTHEQKSAELEKQFGEGRLRKGYTHDVPIAEGVTRIANENKKEISNIYNGIEKDLVDQNVLIPNSKKLAAAENHMRKLMKDTRLHFKNDEEFESAVKKWTKSEQLGKSIDIVPAADVLKNYRTVRHLGQKLRKEAFSTKVAGNKDLQSQMLTKADEFENTAQNLESLLESNDLGESLGALKTANKRWREEVTPLYRNKTYQQFLKGMGPDNIMKALRGNGPGQEIIRNIIKKDPELLRNIVGQRYANNPAKLHEFDELTHEYTQHMPEVLEFRQQHFASKQNEAQAKMQLDKARHEHQLQKEQVDIAHRKQVETAKAENTKAREQASEQTRLKKAEVHKENIQKQKEHEQKTKHFKMQEEIKSLEQKHSNLTESADKLKEKAKRKNISLKEKIETENQISDTKKQLSKLDKDIAIKRRVLKSIGYGAATLILGGPAYNTVASKLGLK